VKEYQIVNIFILDDEADRIRDIKKYNGTHYTDASHITASDALSAKVKLSANQPWEAVYLDFQLRTLS